MGHITPERMGGGRILVVVVSECSAGGVPGAWTNKNRKSFSARACACLVSPPGMASYLRSMILEVFEKSVSWIIGLRKPPLNVQNN